MNIRLLFYLAVFIFLIETPSAQAAFEVEDRPTMGQWLQQQMGEPWNEDPVGKELNPGEGKAGDEAPGGSGSSVPDPVSPPSSEQISGKQQIETSAQGAGLGKDHAPPVENPSPSSFQEGEAVKKDPGWIEPVENSKLETIKTGELVEENLGLLEPGSEPKPKALTEAEFVEESLGLLEPVENSKPGGVNEKQISAENTDFSHMNSQSPASVLNPAFAGGLTNPLPAASMVNSLPTQNAASAVSAGSVLPRTDGFVPSLP